MVIPWVSNSDTLLKIVVCIVRKNNNKFGFTRRSSFYERFLEFDSNTVIIFLEWRLFVFTVNFRPEVSK